MASNDLQAMDSFVARSAQAGRLVVQPRMGMADPRQMAEGLRAVAQVPARTVGTITLDSYTRVADHDGARRALAAGQDLNGYPLVAHGARTAAEVAAAASTCPVQIRHGSAIPGDIFSTMVEAGLTVSEGGPVSYCLPYGRTPLVESVAAWKDATQAFGHGSAIAGQRAHLETFGGCMLGQLCPPSLLVAISLLEGMFFVEHGIDSVSLSYAQQTHPVQDVEALAALRLLAEEFLPAHVKWHIVLYTYMGVFPRTLPGAQHLLDSSTEIAVRGGAERMIVKTAVEAHRIPTVDENLQALIEADARAQWARSHSPLPTARQVDMSAIATEARELITAVLQHGEVGASLLTAFRKGTLDVPFCLHDDNRGLTQGAIDSDGRLKWAHTGHLPIRSSRARMQGRITSHELRHMLNFTAERHDRLAATGRKAGREISEQPTPHRIAVIGTGPRGLAVIERLGARLRDEPPAGPVEIYAIDSVEPGAGRIWRTDQPASLLMNTPAGEVTMFSGPPDGGPTRSGAGPSLAQWWSTEYPDAVGDHAHGYAPRGLYGHYLRFVLRSVGRTLPEGSTLHPICARVENMERRQDGGWQLRLDDDSTLDAHRAVLTTGHPVTRLAPSQQGLADFSASRESLHYIRGDAAGDMPLDSIPAGATVGVLGMGLSFYDVMSLLTEGRGGRYTRQGADVRYHPSGREPRIFAGSRSGVPLPARGRNQKAADHCFTPRLFTRERMLGARARGKIDFDEHVLPWLLAEICLVYYGTEVRRLHGSTRLEQLFLDEAVAAAEAAPEAPQQQVVERATRFGCGDLPPLDLAAWARPLAGATFADRASYEAAVADLVRRDLHDAAEGNFHGPVKAALDTIRDVRGIIRVAVNSSGLAARSHEEDFLSRFVPVASHLSAGPPAVRLEQVLALVNAGILRFIGPDAMFGTDAARDCFTASSPHVGDGPVRLDAIVDARIPAPDIRTDTSSLTAQLYSSGIITSYANVDDDTVFATGGMAVTDEPFHPLDSHGQRVSDLCVLGIPTEYARWFTQVGSSRPGPWGDFMSDADAVAADTLVALHSTSNANRGTKAIS
ncbi:FAD/NAD(P)-binding protein [Streptomyces kunmingensis]|uniref:FAD/NAD(P)-binding protein n=1 Tax=Streptomyces kunmingensis TaxID=68225 RepID=A0ABU6C906_9ACTN|nr:FAD/NAD(P)-binding protein [Streptomyces kunmingensis]MEB3961203.1 FAD/NAD(P)-binding protein [Streptomyces kunmingensis]